jgi:hypothetical protein
MVFLAQQEKPLYIRLEPTKSALSSYGECGVVVMTKWHTECDIVNGYSIFYLSTKEIMADE